MSMAHEGVSSIWDHAARPDASPEAEAETTDREASNPEAGLLLIMGNHLLVALMP